MGNEVENASVDSSTGSFFSATGSKGTEGQLEGGRYYWILIGIIQGKLMIRGGGGNCLIKIVGEARWNETQCWNWTFHASLWEGGQSSRLMQVGCWEDQRFEAALRTLLASLLLHECNWLGFSCFPLKSTATCGWRPRPAPQAAPCPVTEVGLLRQTYASQTPLLRVLPNLRHTAGRWRTPPPSLSPSFLPLPLPTPLRSVSLP